MQYCQCHNCPKLHIFTFGVSLVGGGGGGGSGGGGASGGGCEEKVLKPMSHNPINRLNPVSVNGEELLNTLIDHTDVLVRPFR